MASTVRVRKVGDNWEADADLPGGYLVVAGWTPESPFAGPSDLHIRPDWTRSKEWADSPSEQAGPHAGLAGITGELLRSVPLKALADAIRDAMFAAGEFRNLTQAREALPVGRAGRGQRFYAECAAEYAQLVAGGERHPIAMLSRLQGVSVETVRARIKRARALGLLEGPPGGMATNLTQLAEMLLRDQPEN